MILIELIVALTLFICMKNKQADRERIDVPAFWKSRRS